jgi:hypothetical protein
VLDADDLTQRQHLHISHLVLTIVVTRILPAKQRVAVLFDFLGRKTTLELDRCQVRLGPDQQTQRRRTPIANASVPPVFTFD